MNFKTIILSLVFLLPITASAQETQSEAQYQRAIEEVLAKVDHLDAPVLKNTKWQSFTQNYTQFLRGYVICMIIGDNKMIKDWLNFYKTNQLDQFPTDEDTVLDKNDEDKITNFLKKVKEIKEKI